jgi:hypothetical protein
MAVIFPQIVSEWGSRVEYLDSDLHVWLMTTEMNPVEFVDSFNTSIHNNRDQQFSFPGQSLEVGFQRRGQTVYLDEVAAWIQTSNLSQATVFVEIKSPDSNCWLFNLK